MKSDTQPDVTDAHRRAAFEAMHWSGWTYEQAMADDTRSRVVEARAHQLRTQASRGKAIAPTPLMRTVTPPQCAPRAPQVPALHRPPLGGAVDRKRAAAGDRDD